MQIDGSCHCGEIAYRAEADPTRARICHCTDCQSLSGSAFRTVIPVAEADFTLMRGSLKVYIKTADSGSRRVQTFCGTCGSPIYATSEEGDNRSFGIRLGTVRQRDDFVPRRQYWARSSLRWLGQLNDMERVEGNNRPRAENRHG